MAALEEEGGCGRGGAAILEDFVSSVFWERPLHSLRRSDLRRWLLMYISTREAPDGPPEAWAVDLAEQALDLILRTCGVGGKSLGGDHGYDHDQAAAATRLSDGGGEKCRKKNGAVLVEEEQSAGASPG